MSQLERFVPTFVRDWARPLHEPAAATTAASGAVLVADIAGFTALAESLARHEQQGAEELQRVLNSCFDVVIGIIDARGGEVFKFAGAATIAWWPATDPSIDSARDAVRAAIGAAAHLRAALP